MVDGSSGFSLAKLLFGSIKKKLFWGFGVLIFLLATIVFITYNLNLQISQDQIYLRDVNAPLGVMVEQVIGYDAMLTGDAHAALLHSEEGDLAGVAEHRAKYDAEGQKLDHLLNVDAPGLINRSRRSLEEKNLVYGYLSELNRINLILVDMETKAFDAMGKNDSKAARELILGEKYQNYKAELAGLYQKWGSEEKRIADVFRERILNNSRNVQLYNLFLGILFILIAIVVPFFMVRTIASPLARITEVTREIGKGNYSTRVNINTGDELDDLGNTLNKMSESLANTDADRKQIDKAKTEFISITSHELRSPMTPMKAQLQMLMEGYFGKLNEKQKESLDIVLRNTDRLDKIIVDFLEISRIEAARLKFNFVKTSLEQPVKMVVEEMKGFMPEKKIDIRLRMEKLPVMEVDPDRAMQVLRNLLNNAIKFSGVNGKIVVEVEKKGSFILFSVQDFGIGIAREAQQRIFEPFFQAEQTMYRQYGGTGLGLAICKGIVESQNGRIWFDSEKGQGTRFYFTIPMKPVRDIRPIRLLFSNKVNQEEAVRKLMIEFLGPLGELEFNEVKKQGVGEKSVLEHMEILKKNKIIENLGEFKYRLELIFREKKEEKVEEKEGKVDLNKLVKLGLIKDKREVR